MACAMGEDALFITKPIETARSAIHFTRGQMYSQTPFIRFVYHISAIYLTFQLALAKDIDQTIQGDIQSLLPTLSPLITVLTLTKIGGVLHVAIIVIL